MAQTDYQEVKMTQHESESRHLDFHAQSERKARDAPPRMGTLLKNQTDPTEGCTPPDGADGPLNARDKVRPWISINYARIWVETVPTHSRTARTSSQTLGRKNNVQFRSVNNLHLCFMSGITQI